jgi:hypothetical protein
MRKLRLEFDRLKVQSFSTSTANGAQGTVVAQQDTGMCTAYCTYTTCQEPTYNPAWTPCGLGTNYECTSN